MVVVPFIHYNFCIGMNPGLISYFRIFFFVSLRSPRSLKRAPEIAPNKKRNLIKTRTKENGAFVPSESHFPCFCFILFHHELRPDYNLRIAFFFFKESVRIFNYRFMLIKSGVTIKKMEKIK